MIADLASISGMTIPRIPPCSITLRVRKSAGFLDLTPPPLTRHLPKYDRGGYFEHLYFLSCIWGRLARGILPAAKQSQKIFALCSGEVFLTHLSCEADGLAHLLEVVGAAITAG